MALALLILGFLGLLGMTWLFPILATILPRSSKVAPHNSTNRLPEFAILIPAHNEGTSLHRTLRSIFQAIAYAKQRFPRLKFEVKVGADGCTDNTIAVAEQFATEISVFPHQGKWKTIAELVKQTNQEWLVLADAGIIWPYDFITKILTHCAQENVIAIAPAYQTSETSLIQKWHWQLERHLKRFECLSGGPVSLHGATVVYRSHPLKAALGALKQHHWLNDDVVLPLMLRSLYPSQVIKYAFDVHIVDQLPFPRSRSLHQELTRRKRMVVGNVQWMRRLLPLILKNSTRVYVLALRRVFRLFWAYWTIIAACGAVLLLMRFNIQAPLLFIFLTLAAASIYISSAIAPQLLDAAYASLLAPYYFVKKYNGQGARWR